MYICLKCKRLFEEPDVWREPHSELFAGSSCCQDDFIEAFRCVDCNRYITDNYIELSDGSKFCLDCASQKELK